MALASETFRRKLGFALEEIETPSGRWVNLTIAGLILISCTFFVVETYPLSDALQQILGYADRVILLIFSGEYLLRLWCAENRLKYVFSLYSLIDLVAILPVFLGFLDIRFIRLLRWFRVLRLIRFLDRRYLVGRLTQEDSLIFAQILFTLFAILFIYSGLIYQVEHPSNPDGFGTFLDALYFSVVTMTTVGFGDVTPTSETGRWMTVLMILTGITTIPWQLGNLVKHLTKVTNQIEVACSNCHWPLHDPDAHFCKLCGAPLPIPEVSQMEAVQEPLVVSSENGSGESSPD